MPRVHTSQIYLPGAASAPGRHEYDVAELRAFFGGEDALEDDSVLMSATPKDSDVIRPLPLRPHGASLSYEHIPRRGFSLSWQRPEQDGVARPLLLSVGKQEMLQVFQQKENQAHVPLGTCIPGHKAFRVVEDFASDPERPSGIVEWVEAGELDWPEDFGD